MDKKDYREKTTFVDTKINRDIQYFKSGYENQDLNVKDLKLLSMDGLTKKLINVEK